MLWFRKFGINKPAQLYATEKIITMARRYYPPDVTDNESELIAPLLPKPQRRCLRQNVNLREILKAIFYLLHEGCQWHSRMIYLPGRREQAISENGKSAKK